VIRIRLRVKFRSFGITFGTLDKQWVVDATPTAVEVKLSPALLTPLVDVRGVTLWVW